MNLKDLVDNTIKQIRSTATSVTTPRKMSPSPQPDPYVQGMGKITNTLTPANFVGKLTLSAQKMGQTQGNTQGAILKRGLGNYAYGSVLKPINTAMAQPGKMNTAMAGLSLFNATPIGAAWNVGSAAVASGLETVRNKRPLSTLDATFQKNLANNTTGIGSQGLGVKGVPGMALDVALTMNPKTAIKAVGKLKPNTVKNFVQYAGKEGKQLIFSPHKIISAEDNKILTQVIGNVGRTKNLSYPDANFLRNVLKTTTNATDEAIDNLSGNQLINEVIRHANLADKFYSESGARNVGMGLAKQTSKQINQIKGKIKSGNNPNVAKGVLTDKKPVLKLQSSPETVIAEAKKQLGTQVKQPNIPIKQELKQTFDTLYSQWTDRYNPIVKASQQAKKVGTVATKNDPEYLVRRLTGAGGIADARFRRELNPVLKEMEVLKIDKADMDVYLANKRIAGFGKAGRDIYGADPKKATQVVQALEAKYGSNISQIADKMYAYQNKGFAEMVEAGFISPENAKLIQSQNPDYAPLYRVMDEMDDYLGLPTRKTMQGTQPILKIKGSKRQILSPVESIIGNTFTQRAAIEKNRVAKALVNLQKITDLGFAKVKEAGEDTITVWNNGTKEYWRVGQDIAETAKGVNEEAMNTVLKLIQAPAALLRQGATGRNPEFMIPNIIRDQLDAGITSKYGYIPFIDYLSGLKSMLKDDAVYQAWESSGAKIDLGELSGKKSIAQLFDATKGKRNLFQWLGAGLDVMGKYSEQPTRVGLFKKALKATGDPLEAMMESRDATVDFARMGSKMKVANSIVPFLNVGVQGFDKLIRAIKDHPSKVLLNATIYGLGPAVATTAYNLLNHKEEYAEIPQYEKDSNFVLVIGRNPNGAVDYVKFPKGNIIPAIANPAESLLNFMAGSNQQSFGEFATSFLSSALPVVGDGQSPKEVAIKTIGSNLPQAIKPLTENLINKSFYKYDAKKEDTKEIVPYYLKNKPAYQQAYKFTPQMYKTIGAVVNVSPLQVQNIMEGYLAGYIKVPTQVVEMATKASRGDEISPNEKTLLRRFIAQTYPSQNNNALKPEPYVPGLMERVTGKAQASETPTQPKITLTKTPNPTVPSAFESLI